MSQSNADMTPRFILDFDPTSGFLIQAVALGFALLVAVIVAAIAIRKEQNRRNGLTQEQRAQEDSDEQFKDGW